MIDSHVHIGGEADGFEINEEIVLQSMKKYEIDISIVSNGDSAEYGENLVKLSEEKQIKQEDTLDRIIRFCRANSGKIYGAFWCKPNHELLTERIDEKIKMNRDIIVALKVHPFLSNLSFSDKKMIPYLDLALKYNLPVIVHTANGIMDSPVRVYEMACRYPQLKFVMTHMGLGTDNKLAIDLMEKAENLFADTTWVPIETTLEVIRRYGSRRVMFGSDNPLDGVDTYAYNSYGEPSVYKQYFDDLKEMISYEDYENLIDKTARYLFGIK